MVSLLLGILIYHNTTTSNESERMRLLWERIATLETQQIESAKRYEEQGETYRTQIAELNVQMVNLRLQASKSEDAEKVLQTFLDAMPFPAWAKEEVPGNPARLQMILLNNAYVYTIGKTKREYIGRTDFAIWPKDIAQEFYDNDLKVLETNGTLQTIEDVPYYRDNWKVTKMKIVKYKIDLPNGRRGVAGIIVTDLN